MKTKEELNALKEEVEALNKKLAELSEEELEQVTGGYLPPITVTRLCTCCEKEFSYRRYPDRGFQNEPTECLACRKRRRR